MAEKIIGIRIRATIKRIEVMTVNRIKSIILRRSKGIYVIFLTQLSDGGIWS